MFKDTGCTCWGGNDYAWRNTQWIIFYLYLKHCVGVHKCTQDGEDQRRNIHGWWAERWTCMVSSVISHCCWVWLKCEVYGRKRMTEKKITCAGLYRVANGQRNNPKFSWIHWRLWKVQSRGIKRMRCGEVPLLAKWLVWWIKAVKFCSFDPFPLLTLILILDPTSPPPHTYPQAYTNTQPDSCLLIFAFKNFPACRILSLSFQTMTTL